MDSSKSRAPAIRRNQGPDILLALRESLIEDSQASHLKDRLTRGPVRRDNDSAREDYSAPDITVTEPSTDSAPMRSLQHDGAAAPADHPLDQNSRQLNSRIAGLSSQSPTIAPTEHSLDVDPRGSRLQTGKLTSEISSIEPTGDSLRAIPRQLGSPPNKSTGENNPKTATVVQLTGRNPQQSELSGSFAGERPSVGRRALRTVARGFVLVAMAVSALALLSYDNDGKRNIVRSWDYFSQRWLQTAPGTNSVPAATAVVVSKPSPQAPLQVTAVAPAAPSTLPAAPLATGTSSDSQQQVDALVKDLAIVRHLVEDLAAKQDQLARDIAALQAGEADVREKIASLPQSSPVHTRPRKRLSKKVSPNKATSW
jgi:hypothetical protein